jgi:hypothetical protein
VSADPGNEALRARVHSWERWFLLGLVLAGFLGWVVFYRRYAGRREIVDAGETAHVVRRPPPGRWQAALLWVIGIAAFVWSMPRPGFPQTLESYIPITVACVFVLPWAWRRLWLFIDRHETTPLSEIHVACIFPILFQVKVTVAVLGNYVIEYLVKSS